MDGSLPHVKRLAEELGKVVVVLASRTTVIAVVAPAGSTPLDGVRATNVRVLRPEAEHVGAGTEPRDRASLDRAVEACGEARRTAAPYLLHDADPLAWVAGAWTRYFEATGVTGDLEVAVAETLARWRARALDLPDYYVVVSPEGLAPTLRHWYLGVLAGAAPARVVALAPSEPITDRLPTLGTGPWWPGLDRLLDGVERVVPDRAGRSSAPPDRPGLIGA
jgi:hypothetical protein